MDFVVSDTRDRHPRDFVEAYVPSDVLLVWKKAKNMPDYNFGKNYLEYKWMEDKFWHRLTEFGTENREGLNSCLVFKGIDYRYIILINGDAAADSEGITCNVEFEKARRKAHRVYFTAKVKPQRRQRS